MSLENVAVESSRVALRFVKLPRAVQAQLDHFVFTMMRKKAQARERGASGARRQMTPRVELGPAEQIFVQQVSERPLGVLTPTAGESARAHGPRFKVVDISTTGLALLGAPPQSFGPRQRIRVRLTGTGPSTDTHGGIDLELGAVVVHTKR